MLHQNPTFFLDPLNILGYSAFVVKGADAASPQAAVRFLLLWFCFFPTTERWRHSPIPAPGTRGPQPTTIPASNCSWNDSRVTVPATPHRYRLAATYVFHSRDGEFVCSGFFPVLRILHPSNWGSGLDSCTAHCTRDTSALPLGLLLLDLETSHTHSFAR